MLGKQNTGNNSSMTSDCVNKKHRHQYYSAVSILGEEKVGVMKMKKSACLTASAYSKLPNSNESTRRRIRKNADNQNPLVSLLPILPLAE